MKTLTSKFNYYVVMPPYKKYLPQNSIEPMPSEGKCLLFQYLVCMHNWRLGVRLIPLSQISKCCLISSLTIFQNTWSTIWSIETDWSKLRSLIKCAYKLWLWGAMLLEVWLGGVNFFQFNIPPNHIPLGSIWFITHAFIHFRYDTMQEVRKSCHFMTWYNIRMSILLRLSIFIYENGQEKISTYPKTLLITWMMAEWREFKVKLLFWVVHSYKKGTLPNFQHRFRFWKPDQFSTIE